MAPRWRWTRTRWRRTLTPSEEETGRTGPPDTTLQRGGEARSTANTEPQDSQHDANAVEPCCRGRRRWRASWSLVLADIGVLIGGVGQVLPESARQQLFDLLAQLLT
jgi:hypothetical protein